MLDDAATIEEL